MPGFVPQVSWDPEKMSITQKELTVTDNNKKKLLSKLDQKKNIYFSHNWQLDSAIWMNFNLSIFINLVMYKFLYLNKNYKFDKTNNS